MSETLVLVTGASGYISGHVIQQLLAEENVRVRGTVRSLKNPEKYTYLHNMGNVELVEADLVSDDGWQQAINGCKYVMHVASPHIIDAALPREAFIEPAVGGTRRVLEASLKSGTVERVIITSSCAAIAYGHDPTVTPSGTTFTPDMWSNEENCDHYSASKMLAEKFAWNFIKEHEECKFDIAVINPVVVFGPLLSNKPCESKNILRQIMLAEYPMLPHVSFGIVDVRDVARAHVRAMLIPEAGGKRFILSERSIWFVQVGTILQEKFGNDGWNPVVREAPSWLVHLMSKFDSLMSRIVNDLDYERKFDFSQTEEILRFKLENAETAIIEMAESMIQHGMVQKPQPSKCVFL